MPQQATVYRVLIASPTDVAEERDVIRDLINQWNYDNTLHLDITLQPVSWETHATPAFGDRPQAIINKQLVDKSDILVAVFWTRLGTHTGEAESGTVEEIQEFLDAGKPVLLYFSSKPVLMDSVDLDQYQRLQEFKTDIQGQALYEEYGNISELKEQLLRHLSETIRSLHDLSEDTVISDPAYRLEVVSRNAAFQEYVQRLQLEWKAESSVRQTLPHDAHTIMGEARLKTLDYAGKIDPLRDAELVDMLQEVMMKLTAAARTSISFDNEELWRNGDEAIAMLQRIVDRNRGVDMTSVEPHSGTAVRPNEGEMTRYSVSN